MVRECNPPEREPTSSWPARRSTMATSTPAKANSAANISPVGPPPAITTACPVNALRENSQSGARFEAGETAAAAAELDEDPAVGVVDEKKAHEAVRARRPRRGARRCSLAPTTRLLRPAGRS